MSEPEQGIAPIRVLVIEDDPGDADLLHEMLSEVESATFQVDRAATLQAGLERLAKGGIDVVLVDLGLPDSQGLETFAKVHEHALEIPVIMLTGLDDDTVALQAVRNGAQDYLVKGQADSKTLSRVLRYAMERHETQMVLRNLSLLDELTGLYNRRGFLSLADHHLKLAARTQRELVLLMADLDHMKQINDTFGHQEGDLALVKTAKVLRDTFRSSDIIARIGGDEFAVIAVEAHGDDAEMLKARLQEHLALCNTQGALRWRLSLSVGAVAFASHRGLSLERLMAQADAALYEEKRSKP